MNEHLPIISPPTTIMSARPPSVRVTGVAPYDFSSMVAEWMGMHHAELAALLVKLRFLQMVHQTHHWISKGDPFYGDHLLFERLYDTVTEHVDSLAERIVGLASEGCVDPAMHARQLSKLFASRPQHNLLMRMPNPDSLAHDSLEVEQQFIIDIDAAVEGLTARAALTRGLDNLLAQISDDHEQSVYLLKQRCGVER